MALFLHLHSFHVWEINPKSFYFSLKNTRLLVGEAPTIGAEVSRELNKLDKLC